MKHVGAVIIIAAVVLVVIGLALMAWRLIRLNEEPEQGGSYGHQFSDVDEHRQR